MTNDVQGNNVAVHNIFPNGTVDYVHSVSTGGRGAQYQVLTSGPPGPDGLRSAHSVVVSNNRLYNANVSFQPNFTVTFLTYQLSSPGLTPLPCLISTRTTPAK